MPAAYLRLELGAGGPALDVNLIDGSQKGLDQILVAARNDSATLELVGALNKCGQIIAGTGNAEGGARVYGYWVQVTRTVGNRFMCAQGLNAYGLAKRAGDVDTAMRAYQNASALLTKPLVESEEEEMRPAFQAFVLQNIATLWHGKGNAAECKQAAREALTLVEHRTDALSQQTAVQCRKHLQR